MALALGTVHAHFGLPRAGETHTIGVLDRAFLRAMGEEPVCD